MPYYVYMLKTLSGFKKKTYIGYTINLKNRLNKHNSSKGAKATKGYKWKIIYKKRFYSKNKAM
jgi:putative endonuclease